MITKLAGAKVYDPAHGVDGDIRDVYIRDGHIIAAPDHDEGVTQTYNLNGKILMAGAIDLHTHIGGGKVNLARTLMTQEHHEHHHHGSTLLRSGSGIATPSTLSAGYHYAQMGYTSAFEPAVLPSNARQAHLEMADTPMLDTGGYIMLGSDDLLLQMMNEGQGQSAINDYVAWTLNATQSIGVKTVNPGGINAFKFNQRSLDVDEENQHYGVTPRRIVHALSQAIEDLGVPFPLHVHASNLGVPGNFDSTIATMHAAEGNRIHLTHIQFHSYGTEGDRKFSSAAAEISEAVNGLPNVTIDVGQILFGQTVTASGDTMSQHRNHPHGHPKKWVCMDIECEAGCGVVPFRYKDKDFVNALQWSIGLEIFLMVEDPWRVFLTTDHPNGAPFTSYPHLIRLLMDKTFRNDQLEQINPGAREMSVLHTLEREYSLYEIAIMTRAAPARLLGMSDYGHMGVGAVADLTVYNPDDNPEIMFATPLYVFKEGELVVENGDIVKTVRGRSHVVHPEYDRGIESRVRDFVNEHYTVRFNNLRISDDEMAEVIGSPVVVHPCKERSA